MSGIFVILYFDEDVSSLLSKLLQSRGFDVLTTHEASQNGSSDEAQLAFATEQGRAILTHNRVDFERLAQLYIANGQSHSGIIIVVRRKPHDILQRLLRLLDQVTVDEMRDQLRYI